MQRHRAARGRDMPGSIGQHCFVPSMASNTWEYPVKRVLSVARLRAVNFDEMLLLPLLSNPESRKEVSRGDLDKVCPAKWPVRLRRSFSYTIRSQVALPAVLRP